MKYVAPELKVMTFNTEEAVAAPLDGSSLYNDTELDW